MRSLKNQKFISNLAITGIYIYEFNSIEKIKKITFSHRGEREVTDLNNIYLREEMLRSNILAGGMHGLM